MAGVFEPVTLGWKGKEYRIQPDRIMPLLARIEDVITLAELAACAERRTLPLAKIATAFAVALEHAGARVKAEDVYAAMFSSGETQQRAVQAVDALLGMMLPPEAYREDEDATRKPQPPAVSSPRKSRSSSGKPSRRRPASGG